MKRHGFWGMLLGFAIGMGGNLHYPFPGLGYVAMLDFAAYVVAIPIILLKWNRMGRFMRRSLLWAFAWTMAAMLANVLNFVDMKYWAKCVTLASASWAIMAASYLVLKENPMAYMWYLVGAGISGWISLHYFRNGALEAFTMRADSNGMLVSDVENLMDKQVFPLIAMGIYMGIVLPVVLKVKKFPAILIISATAVGGVWLLLHGGSRSSFGRWCAAAGVGFMVAYCKTLYRRLGKRPFIMIMLATSGALVVFGAYAMMAKSGALEEGESAKFEREFGEKGGGLTARSGLKHALEDAVDSCFIGKGWHLRNHSVWANSLACEGIVGFLFWIYFFSQVLWFVCRRMPYTGRYATFITLMILSAVWDAFGSPFSTRHKFFVLMALIAICRDNPYYGVGYLFDKTMIRGVPLRH